jgi:enoyl-CoA hydratase/carnithine racemase
MQTQFIGLHIEDDIGFVTLNRPVVHNALNIVMWEALPAALVDLKSRGAKAIVISGQGDSFASGADIEELKGLADQAAAKKMWCAIKESLYFISNFEIPTIASINGPCLGGGCLLAMSCDLRYASTSASFSIPIAKLGIILDYENIEKLVAIVGPAHAKELLYTGSTISGEQALSMGLVNWYGDGNNLPDEVRKIGKLIVANSSISIKEAKRCANRAMAGVPLTNQERQQEMDTIVQSYLGEEMHKRLKQLFP